MISGKKTLSDFINDEISGKDLYQIYPPDFLEQNSIVPITEYEKEKEARKFVFKNLVDQNEKNYSDNLSNTEIQSLQASSQVYKQKGSTQYQKEVIYILNDMFDGILDQTFQFSHSNGSINFGRYINPKAREEYKKYIMSSYWFKTDQGFQLLKMYLIYLNKQIPKDRQECVNTLVNLSTYQPDYIGMIRCLDTNQSLLQFDLKYRAHFKYSSHINLPAIVVAQATLDTTLIGLKMFQLDRHLYFSRQIGLRYSRLEMNNKTYLAHDLNKFSFIPMLVYDSSAYTLDQMEFKIPLEGDVSQKFMQTRLGEAISQGKAIVMHYPNERTRRSIRDYYSIYKMHKDIQNQLEDQQNQLKYQQNQLEDQQNQMKDQQNQLKDQQAQINQLMQKVFKQNKSEQEIKAIEGQQQLPNQQNIQIQGTLKDQVDLSDDLQTEFINNIKSMRQVSPNTKELQPNCKAKVFQNVQQESYKENLSSVSQEDFSSKNLKISTQMLSSGAISKSSIKRKAVQNVQQESYKENLSSVSQEDFSSKNLKINTQMLSSGALSKSSIKRKALQLLNPYYKLNSSDVYLILMKLIKNSKSIKLIHPDITRTIEYIDFLANQFITSQKFAYLLPLKSNQNRWSALIFMKLNKDKNVAIYWNPEQSQSLITKRRLQLRYGKNFKVKEIQLRVIITDRANPWACRNENADIFVIFFLSEFVRGSIKMVNKSTDIKFQMPDKKEIDFPRTFSAKESLTFATYLRNSLVKFLVVQDYPEFFINVYDIFMMHKNKDHICKQYQLIDSFLSIHKICDAIIQKDFQESFLHSMNMIHWFLRKFRKAHLDLFKKLQMSEFKRIDEFSYQIPSDQLFEGSQLFYRDLYMKSQKFKKTGGLS